MDPLAEIKQIYFRATRATIARDFDRAIDLLKSMVSEEDRERASVYMDGLAEMRADWAKTQGRTGTGPGPVGRGGQAGGPGGSGTNVPPRGTLKKPRQKP